MRKNLQLVGILALALVLRILFLQSRSIIYDDAFSVLLSQQGLAQIISGTAADTMPPLYYFILHFWMKISTQLWFLRMLSVLLSMGSVYLIYRLTSAVFSRTAGLWAGLITAVSPLQLYHAQDLRMYALVVFAQLAYAWFFYRLFWSTQPECAVSRWDWAGLVVSGTAAMYSHNLAIFGLVIPNLLLLWKHEWKKLGRLLLAQALIFLLALPWLVQVPGQVEKIQRAFWTPRPGLMEIFQAVLLFTLHLPLSPTMLLIGAILSVQALITIVWAHWKDPKRSSGSLFFTAFALFLPAMLLIVSYVIRPVFVARGFLVASLAYYALAGRAIDRLWTRGIGMFLAGAILVCAVISIPAFYQYNQFPRSPFAEAGQYLEAQTGPGDIVLHDNKLSYFPVRYYQPGLSQAFLADEPSSPNDTLAFNTQKAIQTYPLVRLEDIAFTSNQKVFFVVFQETIDEYRLMGESDHPQLVWLQNHLEYEDTLSFGDLNVYIFRNAVRN